MPTRMSFLSTPVSLGHAPFLSSEGVTLRFKGINTRILRQSGFAILVVQRTLSGNSEEYWDWGQNF